MDNAAFQSARLAAVPGLDPPQFTHYTHPLDESRIEDEVSGSRFTLKAVRPYAAYVEGRAEHTNDMIEDLQHEDDNDDLQELIDEIQDDPDAAGMKYGEGPSDQAHKRHRRVIRPRTYVHKEVEIVTRNDEQEEGRNESEGEYKDEEKQEPDNEGVRDAANESSTNHSGEQHSEREPIHIYPEADSWSKAEEPSEDKPSKGAWD